MDAVHPTVSGPQISAGARRFQARLQIYVALRRVIRSVNSTDVLTLAALAMLFIGLSLPAAGFAVVGALLIPITPIGTAIRLLLRGR